MAVDESPDAFGSEPENIEELIEEDIRTGMHTFFGHNQAGTVVVSLLSVHYLD